MSLSDYPRDPILRRLADVVGLYKIELGVPFSRTRIREQIMSDLSLAFAVHQISEEEATRTNERSNNNVN